jgi:iron complex transport system substrate-binding protein
MSSFTSARSKIVVQIAKVFRHLTMVLLLLSFVFVVGCGDGGDATTTDDKGSDAPDLPKMRLVSLSPALTRIIVDLGRARFLVGVGDNDDMVPEEMEVDAVGPFNDVDLEKLISLRPTHVIISIDQGKVPTKLSQLAEKGSFELVRFDYPTTLRDIDRIILPIPSGPEEEVASMSNLFDDNLAALSLFTDMRERLSRIDEITGSVTSPGKKPRVLMVFGVGASYRASGPGTVFHDVLMQVVNGYNAAIPRVRAPSSLDDKDKVLEAFQDPADYVGSMVTLDREMLLNAEPDVILLLLPNAPELDDIDTDPRLSLLKGLNIPAVKNNRVVLINEPYVLLPSTTIVNVAALMAKAVHPQVADDIDQAFARIDEALRKLVGVEEQEGDEKNVEDAKHDGGAGAGNDADADNDKRTGADEVVTPKESAAVEPADGSSKRE